jgi:hypothetical protein
VDLWTGLICFCFVGIKFDYAIRFTVVKLSWIVDNIIEFWNRVGNVGHLVLLDGYLTVPEAKALIGAKFVLRILPLQSYRPFSYWILYFELKSELYQCCTTCVPRHTRVSWEYLICVIKFSKLTKVRLFWSKSLNLYYARV